MPSIISTIPAVIDALVQNLTVVLTPCEVQVVDGQPVGDLSPDIVCVGFSSIPGEPVVENTLTPAVMARTPDLEAYDITCLASSWKGAQTVAKVVRDRAFELVGAVSAELARDPTLGRVAMRSWLSAEHVAPEQTTEGATCTVRFVIHVEAFARRA
jgi:hypothetical protein